MLRTPIIAKDFREFSRDHRLVIVTLVMVLLAVSAIAVQWHRMRAEENVRESTEALDRQTWLTQGAINPHAAAHFSSWAFRPETAMSLIDPGTLPYSGSAIWMEAHVQDFAELRPVEDRATALDLGEFSLSWVSQIATPLIVALLTAGLVVRERERGTLKMILAGGTSIRSFVLQKLSGLLLIAGVVATIIATAGCIAVALAPAMFRADQLQRFALWLAADAVYICIAVLLSIAVGVHAKTALAASTMLLGLWAAGTFVLPKLAAGFTATIAQEQPAQAFWAQIAADEKNGMDGNGGAQGAIAFRESVLQRYGVTDIRQLPVNFAGLRLNEGERVNAYIFDKRYAEMRNVERRQRRWMRFASLFTPVVALQNISMGVAGTDNAHQWDFADQAEAHRRQVVHQLNNEMTLHAGALDFNYKAGAAMLQSVPAFIYKPPPWKALASSWLPDGAVLLLWVLVAGGAVAWSTASLRGEIS